MQQGGVRGALALAGAVLGLTLSLFKLVPELSRYDLDDVAGVVYIVSVLTAYGCICFVAFTHLRAKHVRRGTLLAARAMGVAAAMWFLMFVLVISLVGPSLDQRVTWTLETIQPAVRWIASLSPPIFAAGTFWAYRIWMRHRYERELQCEWCLEWVKLGARKCRFCGSEPKRHEQEQPLEQEQEQPA